ncbi:hypothetical protein [Selenomonas sp. FC4001]|jgi:hypothetical protein|uniref:hypothetical protein n=1 Tax=Selenomonas sp. FC4001 TaxID=1408313 RepID=UPI0012DC8BB5|nr:hypothetical protein [Selenomonas sp. FC4001]MBQ1416300.1 hypothetical protein [Selenomonas sp.]
MMKQPKAALLLHGLPTVPDILAGSQELPLSFPKGLPAFCKIGKSFMGNPYKIAKS